MKGFNARYQRTISFIGRIILGATLVAAGGLKAFVPAEAAGAVAAYKILPVQVAHLVGYALPWLEIAIGVLLIIGSSIRMASVVAGGIMVLFIGAIISLWARGLLIDCGCFGGGGVLAASKVGEVHRTYALEIARDLGLALVALYLYFFPHGLFSVEKSAYHNEEI